MDSADLLLGDSRLAFASVKYWSRETKGPREHGLREEAVRAAAEKVVDGFEEAWRAGANRSPDVMVEVQRIIKERRQSHGKRTDADGIAGV